MDLDETIIRAMRGIDHQYSQIFTKLLSEADLTLPQHTILSLLHHSGDMTMTDVSYKLRISKPAVTHIVDQLTKRKMLTRKPHATDRRAYQLKILQKGRSLITQIEEELIINIGVKAISSFSEQEKEMILRFFDVLAENLDEALSEVYA